MCAGQGFAGNGSLLMVRLLDRPLADVIEHGWRRERKPSEIFAPHGNHFTIYSCSTFYYSAKEPVLKTN
jgi:hypothetical protein